MDPYLAWENGASRGKLCQQEFKLWSIKNKETVRIYIPNENLNKEDLKLVLHKHYKEMNNYQKKRGSSNLFYETSFSGFDGWTPKNGKVKTIPAFFSGAKSAAFSDDWVLQGNKSSIESLIKEAGFLQFKQNNPTRTTIKNTCDRLAVAFPPVWFEIRRKKALEVTVKSIFQDWLKSGFPSESIKLDSDFLSLVKKQHSSGQDQYSRIQSIAAKAILALSLLEDKNFENSEIANVSEDFSVWIQGGILRVERQ